MKCPKCGYEYERLLALSREDNETMICDICGMKEALEDFRRATPQERTRRRVEVTGNRWAIENFRATHG